MDYPMRMKVTNKDGVGVIRLSISHPMETGLRKDSRGETIPAHYITHIRCTVNGDEIMNGETGFALSKNPYLGLRYADPQTGDVVAVDWVDNQGNTGKVEARLGK